MTSLFKMLHAKAAFSLVELLVVIAVIAMLMSVIAPAAVSLLNSVNLTHAGQIVADQIVMARQAASASNRNVEIRFIKVGTGASADYTAFQIMVPGSSGDMVALGKVVTLPQGIAVCQNEALSPPFADPQLALTGTMPFNGGASSVPYTGFRIRPSGEVEPVPSTSNRSKLYLTLAATRYVNANSAPANYVTVQINPDSGTVILYRP